MRDFAGTPGTLTALFLRISQCVFAAASITAISTTSSFFNFTAFWGMPKVPNGSCIGVSELDHNRNIFNHNALVNGRSYSQLGYSNLRWVTCCTYLLHFAQSVFIV
ncbi:hypothetical protein LINPERPRIM_LOCUS17041 [Linum perenne]